MAASAVSPVLDDGVAIKKEIYLSSQSQRRMRCCMKYHHNDLSPWFHCFRCLIFSSLHPLILLQRRYAFIKRKRFKSFLAPKARGWNAMADMAEHTCTWVCMSFLCVVLSCLVAVHFLSERLFQVAKVRRPSIYNSICDLKTPDLQNYIG